MSITLRRDALHARQHDLRQARRAHRSHAASLKAVTRLISKNAALNDLVNFHFDAENSPPPDSDEASWLDAFDLDHGRIFDDASIPYPTFPKDAGLAIDTKPSRPSPQPSQPAKSTRAASALAQDADPTSLPTPSPSGATLGSSIPQKRSRAASEDVGDLAVPATYAEQAAQQPDGPVALPSKIAPPEPDEEAQLDDAAQQLLDLDTPERPAKVVRLPTEDEQRDADQDAGRRRSDEEPTRQSRGHLHTHSASGEVASSPSSTVGAYSAATPMPPQDSPDTSPDSETGEQIEILPPKELRPSPEEQRQKEEHDRLLEAQKELARKAALGDISSTPDDQLRWEEREAAARDAEERAAREDVGGPEPSSKRLSEQTDAGKVVDDVIRDRESAEAEKSRDELAQDNADMTEAAREPARMGPLSGQEDEDNITVAPRNKAALTIDTSRQSRTSPTDVSLQQTPSEQDRMATRTSSGSLQRRSTSELLGQTPSHSVPSRRTVTSPETLSPTARRMSVATPTLRPSSSAFETPSRFPKQPGLPRTPSDFGHILVDIMALKGAAEDPDRDYLEPLFRIQAHDSPSGPTTPLPDLIRSASKTLSTEDQSLTMSERLDNRLLRRIYQLQNANRWSLRQMDRCKEPEPQVTHHDHTMAEMKWMRKDFKAERKAKISVCAWLARRCADWVAASSEGRKEMQVVVKPPRHIDPPAEDNEEQPPGLEPSGDSAAEDEAGPPTPTTMSAVTSTLIVPPELSETVSGLQKSGNLHKVLKSLPVIGFADITRLPDRSAINPVSKFTKGKVLPMPQEPRRKRSRFEYEDEGMDDHVSNKKLCVESNLPPEDQESALFNPENKPIRDRLHANNAFRPPSEFAMPSIQFYEYRSGSQWIWEDDQRLRKLAKDYSFNWSLIADELQLPTAVKSSAERRTPWECFERWVELEQLPAEMKKTVYFKTWFQRLETSQQAAERRYQAQVAALQAQNNGQAGHIPPRRRTVPNRVEKRRNTRYLWLVDAMRKGARKKEQAAYKQAEAQRAAAQRKTQADANQPRAQIPGPQEFSRKRHERDMQELEARRQHLRQKQAEQRQAQLQQQQARMAAQGQQPGMANGAPNQQRPNSSSGIPGQQGQMQGNVQGQHPQQGNVNGQMQQPGRPQVPVSARSGHLAVPHMNGQAIPQAQMRPNGPMTAQDMQRMAQANAQARAGQYTAQQQYAMQNANMQSPGGSGMTTQQQMQSNNAMLANLQQQMNGATQHQASPHQNSNHQMSVSPSMPPPPAPQLQQGHPQQLSSGHVPALMSIKAQIRAKWPQYTEEQVNSVATEMLKSQSQSSTQARQSAMNAAAGIGNGVAPQGQHANMQAYAHNQAAYQQNANQMATGNYAVNGDMSGGQQQQAASMSSSPQQQYANMMRQRAQAQQLQQMRSMQQSPNGSHANLNGSPSMAQASPNMTPASPSMQYANPGMAGQMPSMNMQGMPSGQQRPLSRSATPQMQRLGSAGSVPGLNAGGVQSPGGHQIPQGSPRGVQAGVAR